MTFSLSSSPLPLEKRRNFSKNSKLSDLIMNNPKKLSPDNIKFQTNEEFYSGSEDRTTCQNDTKKREKKIFDRRSFEKYQQSKTLIRLNKSPQERFRKLTLAMISSKGKNTENRSILSNIPWIRKIFILMPTKKVRYFKEYNIIKDKIIYVKDKDLLGYDSIISGENGSTNIYESKNSSSSKQNKDSTKTESK